MPYGRGGGRGGGGGPSKTSYSKNFGGVKNITTNRQLHHTRPRRPPRCNLSNVRSRIINDANDEDLERNAASSSSANNFASSNAPANVSRNAVPRYQRGLERRVRVFDRIRDTVTLQNVRPRLAIGEADTRKSLPITQAYCKLSALPEDVFKNAIEFVNNYISCFDTNRVGLEGAFHENALFSLSVNTNTSAAHDPHRFGDQITSSRNLKHVNDVHRRYEMICNGPKNIVKFISTLQPTEHVPDSFKFDVVFFMPHLLTFSVVGIFREGAKEARTRAYRSFERVFVCIPQNGRICIVNEQCVISNVSNDQFKNYIKKTYEIEKFSNQTRLNMQWSKDCLEYSNWDYDKAYNSFLDSKDKIPADAYIQP